MSFAGIFQSVQIDRLATVSKGGVAQLTVSDSLGVDVQTGQTAGGELVIMVIPHFIDKALMMNCAADQ